MQSLAVIIKGMRVAHLLWTVRIINIPNRYITNDVLSIIG